MRYVYSLIRFVPNPTRAEFLNVGLIAGSDVSEEWEIRAIQSPRRVSRFDEDGLSPEVRRQIESLSREIETYADSRQQPQLFDEPASPTINEAWLTGLAHNHRNLLQFTAPTPVKADSSQQVFDLLWDEFILEPGPSVRRRYGRPQVRALTRQALLEVGLRPERIQSGRRLEGPAGRTSIDLCLANGRVEQLTQCWSLDVSDRDALVSELQSWAWTVRQLRQTGGIVADKASQLPVDHNVPIAVIVSPAPSPDDAAATLFSEILASSNLAARLYRTDQLQDYVRDVTEVLNNDPEWWIKPTSLT